MDANNLSAAMSACKENPSCRKFYAVQSYSDYESYYYYCGLHSQDVDFSFDKSTQYTLYTKKGKDKNIITISYYSFVCQEFVPSSIKQY